MIEVFYVITLIKNYCFLVQNYNLFLLYQTSAPLFFLDKHYFFLLQQTDVQRGFGGEIYDEQTLRKEARKVFGNTERIRARKLRQLKQINDVNDSVRHRPKTIEQSKEVVNELDEAGVCPYSCETPIVLTIDLSVKIIKKREQ